MMASAAASRNSVGTLSLKGVDPEICMIVFKNHWTQVLRILERYDPVRSSALHSGPVPMDESNAVQNYVEHMLELLMQEPPGASGAIGPILEFALVENIMERLFLWSLRRQYTDDMKLDQLRMYFMLIGQAQQPLLHHKPILRPLMMLLSSCSTDSSIVGPCNISRTSSIAETSSRCLVEMDLVALLHQLCCILAKDPSILELFFYTSQDQGAANFLLFSLLIPFTHRQGPVGDQARDALLLIMAVSTHNCRVANHITEHTYFCPVLATGLSGLYSSLPARLDVYSEDWHSLQPADWLQVPSLIQFLHSLKFCSSVTGVAHISIRNQLLSYIYNGFLVPVVAPALHKLTVEEVMTSTAYLDLFLRSVSDPTLLNTFLSFMLLHRHDNVYILDTLVSRINTPFQLGTVSLALFRTLIGLNCEDVMLQLILRYLIPCSHVRWTVRSRLGEMDLQLSAAAAFLSLTPSFLSCLPSPRQVCMLRSKVTEGLLNGLDDLVAGGTSVGYRSFTGTDSSLEHNYLQYLSEARAVISTCRLACHVWSAPYDGISPAPEDYHEEDEERDLKSQREPKERMPSVTFLTSDLPVPPQKQHTQQELEWDDMFDGGEQMNRSVVPPEHIVALRRSAISLIGGSYMEDGEFQNDVLVYDLVAQRDAQEKTAPRRTHTADTAWGERSISAAAQRQPENHCHANSSTASALQNGLDHNSPNAQNFHNYNSHDDQCHQFIYSMEVETRSIMEDAEFGERVQRLLRLLQHEDEGLSPDEMEPEKLPEGLPNETHTYKQCDPFTGPFISVLLSRLENLLENSIEVNLLVTGILTQLATFSQPLLRSFLLCTEPIFQPGVRTLHQVLVTVKDQIERYTQERPGFSDLVREAGFYLLAKDQVLQHQETDPDHHKNGDSWFPIGRVPGCFLRLLPPCPKVPPGLHSRVYAAFLFTEFLKELAALSQEHAITEPPDVPDC
ncbi:protein FAM160A1-like isoform X2 [Denticeps clupeoides]|uniref:FHF complex subunit HOOK-interacting protein C-terminal domain-containing protein n=2 Tax=Denticeps clupeoides TaxID=299321 RepID=A0AAY4C2S2_9TELE|nr:protein FAM160A1-like isoform X2 [Denticeps clupeoides]XP_028824315.1 protein FAM160A1-like isoform X2 [Denticeps clupeoides]XP_028824316.1 protein FAM160A1-like isoform X2 [Denticeps clupeoides]XP_028824317.1 protein FAM160A1-like isoform X2 [Denticeps clupeoides]XP_028824318.1 protein FAM160A1-like isoform X2 [Denticeps clupeoides]